MEHSNMFTQISEELPQVVVVRVVLQWVHCLVALAAKGEQLI